MPQSWTSADDGDELLFLEQRSAEACVKHREMDARLAALSTRVWLVSTPVPATVHIVPGEPLTTRYGLTRRVPPTHASPARDLSAEQRQWTTDSPSTPTPNLRARFPARPV